MILISYEPALGQLKIDSSVTAHIRGKLQGLVSVLINAALLYTTQ